MKRPTTDKYRERDSIPLTDLTLNGLIIMFCLFVLTSIMAKLEEKKNADIKVQAEFMITLAWEDHSEDDVDIWLEDPLGNVLWFRNKEIPMAHIDRDDLGKINDTITLANGETVKYEHNQEIVTIRGFISGEWTLNIHMYRKRDKEPISAEIKIEKLNPSVKTLFYKKLLLSRQWEEVTVTRFIMDSGGNISAWNTLSKKLIKSSGLWETER
ncbi:hypothetical protein A2303_03210 [Candidatus Falkowbacteria bacterium RIFOXYB2_FULL_47_14]|uniref:Uncharacterized protein n=1 Tax=Candidatus Falkowbacteria bacterium RIFOXYA2_FULL_47_19 TaxID=1797994 RepID=A0A1F5SEX4_9BACT|nr:MAG: hypothetical protein A2227_07765 [Candidatus Falkowbacteria bacterium RIFOXYA2_FULL_47_19]OGF35195.1 MAG: hypothetical protein A2468_02045 [Candidatus Falkowbacteria bacterium RIFOXYC2_FULL_46_15]OGF43360.1 MAG: hypothetical protein A2303_03210 [Candidatus Falkowbacteria bacterium RIFOXYB2_FULL_47_14]